MSYDLNVLGKSLPYIPALRFDETVVQGMSKLLQRSILLLFRDNEGDRSKLGTGLIRSLPGKANANPDSLANELALVEDDLRRSLEQVQRGEDLPDNEKAADVKLVLDAAEGDKATLSIVITAVDGSATGADIPIEYGSL